MKNLLRNFGVGASVLMLMGMVVLAQDFDVIDDEGDLSVGRCVAQGQISFIDFLNATVLDDGLEKAVIDPFNDVLLRNQCHASDVRMLVRQRDKLKSQIREAFLQCEGERAESLVKAHARADAELYFVRNLVDPNVISNVPFSLLQSAVNDGSLYTDLNELYEDMYPFYVETGNLTKQEFDILFNRLRVKYDRRKAQYVVCESSSWAEVSKKWNEFIESLAGTADQWVDFGEGIVGRGEKAFEALTDTSYENYVDGWVGLKVNDLNPGDGVDEILDEVRENLPEGTAVTQDILLGAIDRSERAIDTNLLRNEMEARFETLYRNNSDVNVRVVIENLERLNSAIEGSYEPLDKIEQCGRALNAKQCKTYE